MGTCMSEDLKCSNCKSACQPVEILDFLPETHLVSAYGLADYGDPDGDLKDTEAMKSHKLLVAARDGDEVSIRHWLMEGAHIEKRRPFVMATTHGSSVLPKEDGLRAQGLSALMYAAQGGYEGCCRALLEFRANPNAEDEDGLRALHFAAASGSQGVCKVLIEFGADAQALSDDGLRAIHYVTEMDRCTRKVAQQWMDLLGPLNADAGPEQRAPELGFDL
eukprot:TRINITY_DN102441_c0_g1_i1.p1 TRINITY_DN102441_c0_g1~~TRINITY_DN102441_c0_g1_i1.p1  ORF type:complete len:229 (-),score=37.96 TRINITY_DN102441_c0_g1_i1:34-693(-)